MIRTILFSIVAVSLTTLSHAEDNGIPNDVKNTQNPKDIPPTPKVAVAKFQPPRGFEVSLFAGDPDVAQPISMTFDDRGRLWVAECYSYPNWKKTGRDRILIFEDANGDGTFDKRKVFYDKAYNLTGLEIGYGGVWACCAPHLLFIPDKDRNDIPDGKPEVVLDGWTLKARHNIYNGITWGPDGWLWGRHGIVHDSLVGPPGTPEAKRLRLNCGIWRYHPTLKKLERVTEGTTNPWGLDFDDYGEPFHSNNVIGHLWHCVPGAHFKRMYGRDFNPNIYELIDSTSDHLHWGGGSWTSSRGGKGIHSKAGGGHSHAGAMIYLGDNWPKSHRGHVFICNIHGNRINRDILKRKGCGYVATHAEDFIRADNPWFRGIDIDYGPTGAVYVSDWVDLGECHDKDGVHRRSGRIYHISYGKLKKLEPFDLQKKSDKELVQLQLHPNDWFVRHARRILAERARAGLPMKDARQQLMEMYESHPDVTRKLRALWALNSSGGLTEKWLLSQLSHKNEHVRSWVVRLLCDTSAPSRGAIAQFKRMATDDKSGLVRLYLAAMLQRMPVKDRFPIASVLAAHAEDVKDRFQPLMLWYALEPGVLANRTVALTLAGRAKMPKLRTLIIRRITEGGKESGLNDIIRQLKVAQSPGVQKDILQGMAIGLRGQKQVRMPLGWKEVYPKLSGQKDAELRHLAQSMALTFGDRSVAKELRSIVADRKAPARARTMALKALVRHRVKGLESLLCDLIKDNAIRRDAIGALAAVSSEAAPDAILKAYPSLSGAEKETAIATLASRPSYAMALLQAMENGTVPPRDLSVFAARQIQDLRKKEITAQLQKVWGHLRPAPQAKKQQIEQWKRRLGPEVVARGRLAQGRLVFEKTCAQCHSLYGNGKTIGPDLTGSNRADLHYVLENVIDPGAIIGRDYRLNNIYTGSGRLIAGIITEETDNALTVQTATEQITLSKADIEERNESNVSMMPEGIFEKLTFEQVRDLIRYLQTREQVPLAKE